MFICETDFWTKLERSSRKDFTWLKENSFVRRPYEKNIFDIREKRMRIPRSLNFKKKFDVARVWQKVEYSQYSAVLLGTKRMIKYETVCKKQ